MRRPCGERVNGPGWAQPGLPPGVHGNFDSCNLLGRFRSRTHNAGARRSLGYALRWSGQVFPASRPQIVLAQTNDGVEPPALQISSTGSALRVQWDAQGSGADSAAAGPLLALQPYGDYLLPVQTVGVLLSAEAAAATAYAGVTAQIVDVPWQGELAARPALQPPVLDWEPPVAAAPQPELPVPSQPFFLLRSGRVARPVRGRVCLQ